ncbi:MAG: tetratricopeptide repeat protein, partial [Chitinophagaceae bacterium]|nr:tetratricopeptide repeat protein [Chitinophagaceae bacterium]
MIKMKTCTRITLFLLVPAFIHAQQSVADSLRKVLNNAISDSMRYAADKELYNYYEELNRDSALYYAEQNLMLARKNNKKLIEVFALDIKGYQLLHLGRYSESLQCLLQAFRIAEEPENDKEETWRLSTQPSPGKNRLLMLAITHHMFGILMWQTKNSEQEIFHFKEARRIAGEIGNQFRLLLANMNLGNSYLTINQTDSSFFYAKEAERIALQTGMKKYLGQIFSILGEICLNRGDKLSAKRYFNQGVQTSIDQNNLSSLSRNYLRLIRYYLLEGQKDSSLKYALKHLR